MSKLGRRDFLKAGAGASACLFGMPLSAFASNPAAKDLMPLGVITYSFASMPLKPFAVAEYAKQAGLQTVELKIEFLL